MRALVRINTSKMAMARDEEMKLTGWHRPDQKPVRVGWYERDYTVGDFIRRPILDYWDGQVFRYDDDLPPAPDQYMEWRGIAK